MREKYSDTIAVSGARLKTFTREGLKRIHDGALYILEKTGLKVESEDAAEIFHGGGALESGLTHSPAKLVMDHECMGNIRRIVEGVIVDDENLALDIITEVGPGQSYLTHAHTFERMRTQSKAEIFNRKPRDTWLEADNGKTAAEVATKKAKEIIESHQPSPLPHGAEQTMNEMVAEFESKLRAEEYGL